MASKEDCRGEWGKAFERYFLPPARKKRPKVDSDPPEERLFEQKAHSNPTAAPAHEQLPSECQIEWLETGRSRQIAKAMPASRPNMQNSPRITTPFGLVGVRFGSASLIPSSVLTPSSAIRAFSPARASCNASTACKTLGCKSP